MRKTGFRAALKLFLSEPSKYIAALRDWKKRVDSGADPIEAMHGHQCGPNCWHSMDKVKRGH